MHTPLRPVLVGAAVIVALGTGSMLVACGSGQAGVVAPTPTPDLVPPSATPSVLPPSPTSSLVPLPDAALEPGTYLAHPFPNNPLTWAITVPAAGWTGFQDYAVYNAVEGETGVVLGGPTRFGIPTDSCNPAGTAVATSVDDLVAQVQARKDWTVSEPVDATVSGYSGKRIDLELPADVTVCGGNRDNYMVLVEDSSGDGWHAQGPSNRFTLWALDVEGTPLTIMRNSFATSREAWMTQSDAILDSSVITP